jgi:hypothetical protein
MAFPRNLFVVKWLGASIIPEYRVSEFINREMLHFRNPKSN